MTSEHTTEHTPDPIEIITTSLDNTRSLAGAWSRRAACITDDLADAGLRIVATATYPSVTIIESLTGPATCTVKVGDVVRFSGRSFTPDELADGPTVPEAAYHEMAAACRASTAEVDRLNAEIEGLQRQIADLIDACQRKNGDCERYAREHAEATGAARKWQQLLAAIELMTEANGAELVMDGVRITPIGEI